MKVHKKMKKRIVEADTEVGCDGGSTVRRTTKHVDPPECVGKRLDKTLANIRLAAKSHKRDVTHPPSSDSHKTQSYAQVSSSNVS